VVSKAIDLLDTVLQVQVPTMHFTLSKYLSKGKIFLVTTLSLSPLCPRTIKRLSMGEEVV
jgi:hypothetical protein